MLNELTCKKIHNCFYTSEYLWICTWSSILSPIFLHVKTEKEIWATKMVWVLALTILFRSLMGKGLAVLEKKDLGLGKWRGEKAESEQWFGQVAAAWTPAPPVLLLLISKALRRSNYQCFQFPVTQHLWAGTGRKSVCVSLSLPCPKSHPAGLEGYCI